MNIEPRHKNFDLPLSEWIAKIPNELPFDSVGLWQIIPVGADSFGFAGPELESFAKRCIVALINSGAKPVVASAQKNIFWEHQPQYGSAPEAIADAVIQAWQISPSLASHDGLWFDLLGGEFCGGT